MKKVTSATFINSIIVSEVKALLHAIVTTV